MATHLHRLRVLNSQLGVMGSAATAGDSAMFEMVLQDRESTDQASSPTVRREKWNPSQTALIVCDMWNLHHCLNATRRGAELCPNMERLLTTARKAGALIIHAPSGTMSTYEGTPARIRAQEAPESAFVPDGIDEWQYNSVREPRGTGSGPRDAQGPNAEGEGVQDGGYPIDQRDGGEDDDPTEHAAWARALAAVGLSPNSPWTGQTSELTINNQLDFVSDSGSEIWNILESNSIQNVLLMGVHTNMCVLGRPFGLRQLSRLGKNVALVRDMTDTMYNPAKPPYVSHFEGNRLIFGYIETFVCPTTTSNCILGGDAFEFSGENAALSAMATAENALHVRVAGPNMSGSALVEG